ncbi:MAG: hypothetical protein KC503_45815 [Myxococcales bacterium]|nr:hypothetical protein [Myxococcales bacterium]
MSRVLRLALPPDETRAALAGSQPPTRVGSLAPGVFVEDATTTLRLTFFGVIAVSPHDPKVAYVGSYDGYVFKTIDGGKTWDESRLIIEPRPYYGDGGQRLYFGVHRRAGGVAAGRITRNAMHLLRMRGKLALWGPLGVTYNRISTAVGGRVGAAGNVNFGIGVPGRAPRLQKVVRNRFKKPTSGLNIKQTLLERGTRPLRIRQIVVHPKNPQVVYACSDFGLFMTYDGGLNWVRTFQGINPRGRMAMHVAIDPNDDRNVLLATGNGLYVSTDRGENYIKTTAQGVGEGYINWIRYHPVDSKTIFVGTAYGLLRSRDGGKTWSWIYFTTFPPARVVRHVEIDPHDPKRAYISTHDGVFVIDDAFNGSLEDWRRVGGLRFTGNQVRLTRACPKHRGHLWTLTNTKLPMVGVKGDVDTGGAFIWESLDGGHSWRVIYSGETKGAISWFEIDRQDPDMLWIVWSRSLGRLRRPESGLASLLRSGAGERAREADRERRAYLALSRMPSIGDMLIAAMRFTGTENHRRLDYRALARLRALVPRVLASFTWYRANNYSLLDDGRYVLPFRMRSMYSFQFAELRLMAVWNLEALVFDLRTTYFGRIKRINNEIASYLRHAIHRFYGELRRLRARMVVDPPRSLRVRLIYKLRIKELESYLDVISGGYLTRYRKGDHPSPWKTPWFERWPGVRRGWF